MQADAMIHHQYINPAPQPFWLRPLILLLPLLAFLTALGAAPLFDVDEGAFSEATREMFERSDFLFTYLNGEPRFDKPILVYWFQALAVWLFGVNEWAFRLPSALSAIGWCYAVWHFARPRLGEGAALTALGVAATALGPFVIGRAATADGLLNLLLTLALFDAWRHLESGERPPLVRAYLWMGLGFLTKGPIAVLVPGAVVALYTLGRGQWRQLLRMAFQPTGWLLFALVVVPWYVHALNLHGQAFIDGFILRHNVNRFTGTLEGHAGSLFYYVLILPLLLLPWSGALATLLSALRRDLASTLRRFLWVWAGFVLVFFSFSGTKLPHYALYGATPLFLLIAAHANALNRIWFHGLVALGLPTLFLALPWLVGALLERGAGNAYYQAMLSRAPDVLPGHYLPWCAGALALTLLVWRHRRLLIWHKLVLSATLQALTLALTVGPYLGELLQGPVKRAGLVALDQGDAAVNWRFSGAPSFSVYRQAVTPSRPPEPGEMALMRIDRLPPNLDSDYSLLYREGGVVLARRLR